jgi:hypothetical protein
VLAGKLSEAQRAAVFTHLTFTTHRDALLQPGTRT